jgi:hypothetical protein
MCLRELDWSGNRFPQGSIARFVKYFFGSNRIQFLGLDGIFSSPSLASLSSIIDLLPHHKLWGLSICGRPDANFSGKIPALLEVIGHIDGLAVLHMNGHPLTEPDTSAIVSFLGSHKDLKEFSCDGAVADHALLMNFYRRLESCDLLALEPPVIDADRAFRHKSIAQIPGFEPFRETVRKARPASTPTIRAYYFKARGPAVQPTVDDLHRVAARFPKVFTSFERADTFGLSERTEQLAMRSLHNFKISATFKTLHELHAAIVTPPRGVARITRRATVTGSGASGALQSTAPDIGIEPLAAAREVRQVMLDLVGGPLTAPAPVTPTAATPGVTTTRPRLLAAPPELQKVIELVPAAAVKHPNLALRQSYGEPVVLQLPAVTALVLASDPRPPPWT